MGRKIISIASEARQELCWLLLWHLRGAILDGDYVKVFLMKHSLKKVQYIN